jgi:cobalt/nickel transport system permease protein
VRDLFQKLDPRTRLLTIVSVTLIVVSTPRGVLAPFAAYIPICILLILTGRVTLRHLIWRCLAASPFILLASGLLALEGGLTADRLRTSVPDALSVAGKGYLAVILLAFLTASTPLSDLLTALRRMGSPDSLNLILGMMYRYTGLLSEEYSRMERARACRTVRPLGSQVYEVYGRQLGALLLRSWDRAERVHAAMLSRGFTGVWPEGERHSLTFLDVTFLVASCALFLAGRFVA